MFTFEYTNDGANWITQSVSESTIKTFVGGYSSASIAIPNGCKQYRIRIDNRNSYVYINALYMYFSTSGNSTSVKISKKRDDGDWVQHTNSDQSVSSWPGHLYLPFSTIPWSRASTSGHYRYIEILFTPNWGHATNNITLYRLELWGGYPAGSRSLFSWDGDKNATFPAELKASTFKNSSGTEVSYSGHTHDDRYYTESEADTKLSGKVDKVSGKGLSTEDYTTTEKNKLAGIETGANNYTHPATHPPSIIVQDANNRFVTDTEKAIWNGKEPAFSKNTAFNKNFGTAAGTVCQGNDSRLSNARTPTTHTHTKSQITDMPTKLSQFTNDIGAGAGLNIVVSATEPAQLVAGDWWYKEV